MSHRSMHRRKHNASPACTTAPRLNWPFSCAKSLAQVSSVACATEHDGKLWVGNLSGNYVSVLDLADVAKSATAGAAGTAESNGAAS